jgi:hypothetical protein
LRDAGLSPDDARTRVVFSTNASPDLASVAWAAAVGFFGRLIDIVVDDRALVFGPPVDLAGLDAVKVYQMVRLVEEAEPLVGPADLCVQLGGPHPEVPAVSPDAAGLLRLRLARHARVVLSADDTYATLGRVALAAAVRRRGDKDRLPGLVVGAEPFASTDKRQGGIDLDHVRRGARAVRKTIRVDHPRVIVPVLAPSPRQQRLAATLTTDVEAVLTLLGAQRWAEMRPGTSSVWSCPVAHHGDGAEQATVQVVRGFAQCIRCGRDKHDGLRLVMWALGCTADEGVDQLESWGLVPKPAADPTIAVAGSAD